MAKRPSPTATTANLGFEAKLWQAADALRNNMNAAECPGGHPGFPRTHTAPIAQVYFSLARPRNVRLDV